MIQMPYDLRQLMEKVDSIRLSIELMSQQSIRQPGYEPINDITLMRLIQHVMDLSQTLHIVAFEYHQFNNR